MQNNQPSPKPGREKKKERTFQKGKRSKTWAVTLISAGIAVIIAALAVILWATGGWNKAASFLGLEDFSLQANSYPFAMHVLDVGKADAILLECDGHFMLVDGGTIDQGVPVRQYLTRRGVQQLDYVVNTHPDKDHIGGLGTIMEHFPVNTFLTSFLPEEQKPNSTEYLSAITTAQQRHILQKTVSAGDDFSLGSAHVEVLGPITVADDTNNNSIVLRVTYGETVFLLTGDAEDKEEESLLRSGVDLCAHVLKVGHHGSNSSTTQEFLDAVSPQYAAISVGKDNNKLPKTKVLKRLEEAGTAIFRTDLNGVILFGSDGHTIQVHVQNQ